MTAGPVMLVEPAFLHHGDGFTVWHAGVVLSPTGRLVLNLEVDSTEERAFQADAWRLGGVPPIDAYIETPGVVGVVSGSFTSRIDRFAFHFQQWFPGWPRDAGPRRLDPAHWSGSELHIVIHPLDLHLVIDL